MTKNNHRELLLTGEVLFFRRQDGRGEGLLSGK
jgi:hypothetical protein